MDFLDFSEALQQLSADQREALILVGASGMSYEEAADICGCAIGTMKSRVNRARNRLAHLLAMGPGDEFGSELQWQGMLESEANLLPVGD
jgi:RNA polymerase sigma-70 factor (ECF subfamily)